MTSLQQAVSHESDEDFHSLNGGGDESRAEGAQQNSTRDGTDDDDETFPPPEHPLKSMQGPFEESILESTLDSQRPPSPSNAEQRRQRLLDAARYDDSWLVRWRQRPDAQNHPLLKLMAQITFGMHLLQQNQAKSDQEVVRILQNHVDEVDTFLEQTAEDFDLAARDIDERIRFLQLPMQHIDVFNIMLDDKQFRMQLLDGNDKIEKIIDRTARAMNAALSDVSKGRQAGRELSKYLNSVQYTWPTEQADLNAIYIAMRGNEEGWKKCYKDLQAKGNSLGNKLIELGTIISEMSKMAAFASHRMGVSSGASTPGEVGTPTVLRPRFIADTQRVSSSSTSGLQKPLPVAPSTVASAERSPTQQQAPPLQFEQVREAAPAGKSRRTVDERPRTAGSRHGSSAPSRVSGPLSSHPPSRPQSSGNVRADSSVSSAAKASGGATALPRSATQPVISATKYETVNVSSATKTKKVEAPAQPKDAVSGSAFARRWSIRKKHPGPKIEDYTVPESPRLVSMKSATPSLKSASMPRLPTTAEPSKTTGSVDDDPASTRPAKAEPKYRIGSMRLGSEKTRQSVLQDLAATEAAKSSAPSIASSLKRRTLSVRKLFGGKKSSAPTDE